MVAERAPGRSVTWITAGIIADTAFVADTATVERGPEMPDAISVIHPGDVDAEVAARAARRIRDYLAAHPGDQVIELRPETGDDDALVVPQPAAVMFAQILGMLEKGCGVQVMPDRAMLTTQQAADMLNVSRPYLIKQLEAGKIPYEMVGTHRRVPFGAVLDYKRRDDQHRREVVSELTDLGQEIERY
jgi:excisionase family DNA binding protein